MSSSVLRVVAALAVAAFVLSACGVEAGSGSGSSTAGAVPPSGPSGASSAPPPLQDPSSRTPEPANPMTPQPDAVRQVATRWSSATPVRGQAAVLVRGNLTGGPPCHVVGKIDVAESKKAVVITVRVGRERGADCSGPQLELAYPYVVRVALRAPVGKRVVRDGAV